MTRGRALAVGCLVTLAVLLQVSVVARLSLPGGGPALLVLVVAVVALVDGPAAGMLAGFAGGALADLSPPSDHPLGQSVLVLVLVGELVGLLRGEAAGTVRSLVLVVLASVLAGLGVAGLGRVLGQPTGGIGPMLSAVAATALYNVVLAPALLRLAGGSRSAALAPAANRRAEPVRPPRRSRRSLPVRRSATARGLR
jgi:rod shape-determining protein MreD